MDPLELVKQNWDNILNKIKIDHELSNISYESWLLPLEIKSVENDMITFIVPTGHMGISVLNKKYALSIKVAISEVTGLNLKINFVGPDSTESSAPAAAPAVTSAMEQAHLNPKYTFDTFVVGSNNKFAHAASLAVAESPGEIYNPLYLYAGVGLGKTHLMHSIAHFILQNDPSKKVLYVTSEDFTNELIDAIRNVNNTAMSKFREKYRNIDVLLVDDIQFIIGKEATQEEFFHTFNALHGAKKQIIVSSDKPPKDMDILEERIRSRFEWGLIADISSPDYETRVAILRKKEELDGYSIDDKVIEYIATNVKSNIRELEGSLNKIRAKGILDKREINVALAKEVLKDIISPDEKKTITSKLIIDVVAEHFNITPEEIRSQKRDAKYAYPRQVAMYLCRKMTDDSFLDIAKMLGKKDHSTVINGCKRISNELETSETTRNNIEIIIKKMNPSS
ncbi:MAG: chromosomal replication initiator protein DnaA [Lachnospiraceae bacterium]|nr:chromosomal replication initiator protein DnaA [Lachnospiraceae bacterium]